MICQLKLTVKTLYFVIPGDINTRTGGYRYDKNIIDHLTLSGWSINLISLNGEYPFPDELAKQAAADELSTIPDESLVVVDGLAFSVLPEQMSEQQHRLNLVALVHHPLALETGIDIDTAHKLQALETRALACASHVVTTSPNTAGSLSEYAVSDNKISVVCPGTAQAAIATGSQTSTLNLLCVATLTARKGHGVLLDALQQLINYDWHLHCAGSCERDSDTYLALQQQCKKLGLDARVSFLGELEDEQLSALFHQADLFVLASFHEGYGMVLDEAVACGLPIVATAGGAIADTVPEGAGLLVPPGNSNELAGALRSIMADEALRNTLQQGAINARQSLRSWTTAAQEFENVLIKAERPHG